MKKKEEKYIRSIDAWNMCQEVGLDVCMLTLLRWVEHHPELGFQPMGKDGKWYIDKEKFTSFIHYDAQAENKKIFLSLQSAQELASQIGLNITINTLTEWIRKYNLKHPEMPLATKFQCDSSGQWWIYKSVFEEIIHAKNNTGK